MNHRCPHGNRNCAPGTLCTPCSGGGVLRDGEGVTVKMMMCDGMSPELAAQMRRGSAAIRDSLSVDANDPRITAERAFHGQAVAMNAAGGQRTVDALRTQAQRVQAIVDQHLAAAAKRDHALTRNGYDKSF